MKKQGFTLIELLVVVAIIGVLATIVLSSLSASRERALDARRLADMRTIQNALEVYIIDNGVYPQSDNDGCGGWDIGNRDLPLLGGRINDFLPDTPNDPRATGNCNGYRYFRYGPGTAGCPASKGAFYVLGIGDLSTIETSDRPSEDSPGWECPNRNWGNEMDWVTGRFENP